MVEAVLLTCLQANLLITRVKVSATLSPMQKAELTREIRLVTRKDCPIY